MADILSIGTSAAQVYRQALSTVANNIANLNTEGYSRQEVIAAENRPAKRGQSFVGTGALIQGITRSYDEFLENNLRQSNSDLAAQNPLIAYSQRIVDVMAGETTGLVGFLDKFFADAEVLSTDPAATSQRTNFLGSADGLATRIRSISDTLTSVGEEVDDRINNTVATINERTGQLAILNVQLGKSPSLASQAPGLLDQRDSLLKDLSSLVKIHVDENSAGQVTVRLYGMGDSGILISGANNRDLGAIVPREVTEKLTLAFDPFGEVTPVSGVQGGELGGLLSFRNSALLSTIDDLSFFVTDFAERVNHIHSGGMDKQDRLGKDLFRISPIAEVFGTNTTDVRPADARVVDMAIAPPQITAKWHAAEQKMLITDQENSQWFDGVSETGIGRYLYSGIEIDVGRDLLDREEFTVVLNKNVASVIDLNFRDSDEVVTSDRLRIVPSDSNLWTGESTVTFDSPGSVRRPISGLDLSSLAESNRVLSEEVQTNSVTPWAFIGAGSKDVSVSLETAIDSSAEIQLVTRDGVHLLGTRPADPSIWLDGDSFFNEDVDYSDAYINKKDEAAYLDLDILYGFRQEKNAFLSEAQLNEFTSGEVYAKENTGGTSLTWIEDGQLSLNGNALSELNIGAGEILSAKGIAEWLNTNLGTMSAEETGSMTVSAKTDVQILENQLQLGQTLILNGVSITGAAAAGDSQELTNAINDLSASSNVSAFISKSGNLVLTNMPGYEGTNISVSSSTTPNVLGIENAVYSGQLIIESTGAIEFSINELGGALGAPAELRKLGLSAGLHIDSPIVDDMAIFLTDASDSIVKVNARVGAKLTEEEITPRPENAIKIDFLDNSRITITDVLTDTVLRTEQYDPIEGISYGRVAIDFDSVPRVGDSFLLEPNIEAPGDNGAIRRIALLQTESVFSGNANAADAYTAIVNDMGTIGYVAQLSSDALSVVYSQAEDSESERSGVTLDEEAAQLIRFQQSFQAAAQVIQVTSKVFDAIISAAR